MQSFTWSFAEASIADESILASIASPIAYLLVPVVGVLSWQLAAAAVSGFIAKENVVGTLAVCFSITKFIDTEELALVGGSGEVTGFIAKENVVGTLAVCFGITNFINMDELALESGGSAEVAAVMGLTKAAALAYLMFNLYTPPCFAAIGAMRAEMKSAKWLWGGIALQLGVGYTVAFLVYQAGTLVASGSLGVGFVPGLIAVIVMIAIVVALIVNTNRKLKAEKSKA